ncbi:MAG: hypothetical protein JXX14_14625 [Deltaproteobacteria bacterium]|nr:hypothetical protein [Deltaproteobacteria bacterium]
MKIYWCCLSCVLATMPAGGNASAQNSPGAPYQVVIFSGRQSCVDGQTVKSIQVDTEHFPVRVAPMELASRTPDAPMAAQMRDRLASENANVAIWFDCDSGSVHLIAQTDSGWLDQHRIIEIENGKLNAEAISAVIYGWLDALLSPQQENPAPDTIEIPNVASTSTAMPATTSDTTPASTQTAQNTSAVLAPAATPPPVSPKPPIPGADSPRHPQTTTASDSAASSQKNTLARPHPRIKRFSLEGNAMGVMMNRSEFSGGAALMLSVRPHRGASVIFLKGGILSPIQWNDGLLQLRVLAIPLGMGIRRSRRFGSTTLDAGIEFEATINRFKCRLNAVPVNDGFSPQLSAVPMVGVTLHLFSATYLALRGGTRLVVARPVYEVRVNGERRQLYATPIFQPLGYIGIGIEFL